MATNNGIKSRLRKAPRYPSIVQSQSSSESEEDPRALSRNSLRLEMKATMKNMMSEARTEIMNMAKGIMEDMSSQVRGRPTATMDTVPPRDLESSRRLHRRQSSEYQVTSPRSSESPLH